MIDPFDIILIVVLVLILFLFVLSLILFRESLEACCCPGLVRRRRQLLPTTTRGTLGGLRNPGFDEQERERRMPEQRPFDPMEAVESPPSYDEAVKQELFRFRLPPPTQTDRSFTPTEGAILEEDQSQASNTSEGGACAAAPPHSPLNLPSTSTSHSCTPSTSQHSCTQSCTPSTSHGCAQSCTPSTSHSCLQSSRKRVSSGGASHLSTICEEDQEEWPVTVVIDCIGVQASRLLEKCDTSVSLTNGGELGTHSKC